MSAADATGARGAEDGAPTPPSAWRVEALDAAGYRRALPGLASLLVEVVEGGASVSFLRGLDLAAAERFWADHLAAVEDGTVTPFVAVAADAGAGEILGSTLLIRARQPNGPHRAEIAKVLTRPGARGQGIGTALIAAAEARARADDRWLLILDTVPGNDASRLYRRLGWQVVGDVPDYALSVDGVPESTTFYYKDLR